MNKLSLATLVGLIAITASSAAEAQDAGTSSQTQTTAPSTSSPLTPSNDTSSPLTPTPINPVTGQTQQPSNTTDAQSSSEVPATFTPPPIETNRVDASADTSLRLSIDPSSSSAVLLSPDATSLAPTTAGISLNSVQGTTQITSPSPIGSSLSPTGSTSFYPSAVTEPPATQAFLQALSGGASRRVGSARASGPSTAMGPLIGTAAVTSASAVETMTSTPTAVGSSTFMRSVGSSSIIATPVSATANRLSTIGPSALRPGLRGSSQSMFSGRTTSFHIGGSSHH
jgi:hypothetical protein